MYKHSIDLLLESCGAKGPVEVVVTGPGKSHVQAKSLFLPLALLGREEQADLALPDPQVSRRHAYVQMIAGRFFAVDLLSRTGTRWEGSNGGVGWIGSNHVIEVGPYTLRFLCDCENDANLPNPLEAPTLCDHAEPDLALECVQGAHAPFIWRMQSVMAFVGRRAVALGLAVQDAEVSGFHCGLVRTPVGVWVFDLLGQGGTLLNGRRIRWGQLDDRDELQVGQHRFRVVLAAPKGSRGRTTPDAYVGPSTLGVNGNGTRPTAGGTLVAVAPSQPKPALTQDFLVSLFDQFASVQNQMFDQFQHAMTMMVDMFSQMQREQVGLIREEVDRLHQITDEIHALQNQLVNGRVGTPTETPTSKPEPVPFRSPGANEPTKTEPVRPSPATTEPTSDTPPADGDADFTPPPQPEAADNEVHVWLYDKIAELQRERHGRVKRIFDFLRGR